MKENPVDEKSRIIDLLKDLTPLGETPLHIALRYNQTENIEALLTIINLHPEFKSLVDVKNCLGKVRFLLFLYKLSFIHTSPILNCL